MNANNVAVITGRLGRDPELRAAGSSQVATLNVATDSRMKVHGEWQKVTQWHRVIVWGNQAEACARYLEKGSEVTVLGEIRYRSYDKDGQTVYITEINADSVQFRAGNRASNQQDSARQQDSNSYDDIPF